MTIKRVNVATGEVEILNEVAPSVPQRKPTAEEVAKAARVAAQQADLRRAVGLTIDEIKEALGLE